MYFHEYVVSQFCLISLEMILFGFILFVSLCSPRRSLVPLFYTARTRHVERVMRNKLMSKTNVTFSC